MKIKNHKNSRIFAKKILFFHYFKKRVLSIRTLICFIILIFPIFMSLGPIPFNNEINQNTVDKDIFWDQFINAYTIVFRFFPIIIAFDLISGEFSNKTAMILYSTVSRNKVLISKILLSIVHLSIILIFSFIIFEIAVFLSFNFTISTPILISGFFLIFIDLFFWLSVTIMISALSKNSIITIGISYFIINAELQMLFFGEYIYVFKFISYTYYENSIRFFLRNLIFNQNIIYNQNIFFENLILSFAVFICAPLIIYLITFYGFNKVDLNKIL